MNSAEIDFAAIIAEEAAIRRQQRIACWKDLATGAITAAAIGSILFLSLVA